MQSFVRLSALASIHPLPVSRLEKRLFARMLTDKTLKRKLPAEIAEIVEDDLFDHYWAPTAKSWERVDDLWRRKHPALYWERFMTENAMRAWGTLAVSCNCQRHTTTAMPLELIVDVAITRTASALS